MRKPLKFSPEQGNCLAVIWSMTASRVSLGSSIGQALKVPASQLRTIVGCGAAAGVSATFNAPIAGALFAVEVIIGDFAVAQFSPIVIASVVATVASRLFLGNQPAFPLPGYELVSPYELVLYMGVGVVAGLVALGFIRSLALAEDLFGALPLPEPLKAAVGGPWCPRRAAWSWASSPSPLAFSSPWRPSSISRCCSGG